MNDNDNMMEVMQDYKGKEGAVYIVLLTDQDGGWYKDSVVFTDSMSENRPGVYKDRAAAEAWAEELRRLNPSPAFVYRVAEAELVE